MLKQIFNPDFNYSTYIDIKDSRGGSKIRKLHDVICNNLYDFDRSIIKHIQLLHSRESEFVQIADIFAGALSYLHRDLKGNEAKKAVIERIREHSQHSLLKNTLLQERKFNLFIWNPQDIQHG